MEETTTITVTTYHEFEHERCLKKWKPVLDNLRKGIFIDSEEEKFQLFLSVYAEYFQRYVDEGGYVTCGNMNGMGPIIPPWPVNPPPPYNLGTEIKGNLLPINLKVLSGLKLLKKNYEIKNGLPIKEIRIPLSHESYQMIKNAIGLLFNVWKNT